MLMRAYHAVIADDFNDLFPLKSNKNADEELCFKNEKSRYTKIMYRLRKLQKRKKLYRVGQIMEDSNRRKDVFCTKRVKADNIEHSRMVTRIAKAYSWTRCHLWDDVCELLPDCELFINGHKYLIEADTGKMSRTQVLRRWSKYSDEFEKDDVQSQTIFIVSQSKERVQALLEWSKEITEYACFTTLNEVETNPYGRIWSEIGKALKKKIDRV